MLCGALLCCAVVCGAKGALCGAKAVLGVHCVVHRAVHCAVHCVRVPGVIQPCMLDGGLRALAAVGAAHQQPKHRLLVYVCCGKGVVPPSGW